MSPSLVRGLRNLLLAAGVAAASTGGVGMAWRLIGGGALPMHGWIALSLGVAGTVALAWGLMALAFRSHREGWDDRVGDTLDDHRDPDDKP